MTALPPAPPRVLSAHVRQTVPYDVPLRAQSVCLSERPRSRYTRSAHSADQRHRVTTQTLFHRQPPQQTPKRPTKQNKVTVKKQNRKPLEKIPCTVSVQNISIPMKYVAEPVRSTSKTHSNSHNSERIDNRTKSSNPYKQVGDNKRLCATVGCGKETENKLLVQISEARQVSDFERILNSNAIQSERAREHVWRGCRGVPPSAVVAPRPRSAYSLHTVSETYHYLFQQHEDSLQPLIENYRKSVADNPPNCQHPSILQDHWLENLLDLSEFYDEDQALKKEIESITDKIVAEEIKDTEEVPNSSGTGVNFNVNLSDLIALRVNGEGFSPVSHRDVSSPDGDKGAEHEVYEEKEWLAPAPSMSASDDRQDSQEKDESSVDCLAQNLQSIQIDSNAQVPTITFSSCADGCTKNNLPNNSDIAIHLAVPSIDSIDESRPPMM